MYVEKRVLIKREYLWLREIFIELINKTDYLLRALVSSLEKKLNQDQKAWQIEKSRIKSNLKVR